MSGRYGNISGTITQANKRFGNIGGTWTPVNKRYGNIGGTWTQSYSAAVPIVFYSILGNGNYAYSDTYSNLSSQNTLAVQAHYLTDHKYSGTYEVVLFCKMPHNINFSTFGNAVLRLKGNISHYLSNGVITGVFAGITAWAGIGSPTIVATKDLIDTIGPGTGTTAIDYTFTNIVTGDQSGFIMFGMDLSVYSSSSLTATASLDLTGAIWVPTNEKLFYTA
ncbi:hypothetical protein [Caproicibacter sp.]|uniref:hypothetical protein n=1 Tax=Caproicibacter sp. TaxID=2814884 RepID=UPI003989643B